MNLPNDSTNTAASADPGARRRALLYAGVGAAAAVAGAGAAVWKWSPAAGPEATAQSLWPLNFETPAGAPLPMQAFKGKPLLLNFWATWCPPCVEELPLLDSFFRDNAAKTWQVVGLAIDQPSAVRTFLQRTPVSFPVGMAGLGGTELSKAMGNLSGGLPFTVIIGSSGEVAQRRMGRVTPADLAQWVQIR